MKALSLLLILATVLCGCHPCSPTPGPTRADAPAPDASADTAVGTSVTVENATAKDTVVFLAFGSDSVVLPSSWTFCPPSSTLTCSFPLKAKTKQALPTGGSYLNVTISFDSPVTCGTTKAEVNANNPSWYDVTDISLVDGFSNFIVVDANGTKLFTRGKSNNEKSFGVYPLGCDACTSRLKPPCGFPAGTTTGCKTGTQYKPDVPCQYQGPTKGGGGSIVVALVQPEPA